MTKVERTLIVEGSYSVIEAAVCADGRAPAMELLELLEDMVWPNPNVSELPDEYQAKQRSRLLALLDLVADGKALPANSVNYIRDGVWEFVVNDLRLTFYGTRGDGAVDMKIPEPRGFWANAQFSGEYAEMIRVGHYFAKTGQRTPEAEIREAIRVRDEDLAHDRH